MNLQRIKSVAGEDEYVLIPFSAYQVLKKQISKVLKEEYTDFELKDFVQNPIALKRIQAGLTQGELAELLNMSQAYISKIENQKTVPIKLLNKVKKLL